MIGTHDGNILSLGYYAGAALMLIAAGTEIFISVKGECKALEAVAAPLSVVRPDCIKGEPGLHL